MTNEGRKPNDDTPNYGGDRDAALLGRALEGPPMREGFAESLAETLDRAFAEALAERSGVAEPASAAETLVDFPGGDTVVVVGEPQAVAAVRPAAAQPAAGQRVLKPSLIAAVAASLLLVVGVWSSRPSYSWSMMLQAMGDQPWIHTQSVRDGVVRVRRWLGVGQGIDASRSDHEVVLVMVDAGQPATLSYTPGAETAVREPRVGDRLPDNWQQRLPWVGATPVKVAPDAPTAKLLGESWRRITIDGRTLIELTARLSVEGDPVEWVVLLDPETHLPVSAKPAGDRSEEFRFSYPDDGPQSLGALGVPTGTEVVTLDPGAPAPRPLVSEEPQPPAPQAAIEPLPAPLVGGELTSRIDELLADHWASIGAQPVGRSTDSEFLRRVYLDLTGRIPTVGEARLFLEDDSPDRRELLVEDLLASRDHATHLASVWRRGLIPAGVDLSPYGGAVRLDEWLADRFQDNVPYDEIARELLLAEGRISESGPLLFYAALKLNPEEIAAQTSRTFLGMQLECAQCHDHMFDDRLRQEDFWGFAALFAQISRPRGQMDVTSAVLRVHDNRRGEVYLPDTEIVVNPKLPLSDRPVLESADAPPRRHQFVDWLVEPTNRQFSQSAVNRVWAHLFGRGLVDPIDDIREENPAVVPELLTLLGDDFAGSGFDLRRLLRRIVLSDAYQLTSASDVDDPSRQLVFAQMNLKSFTAEQLYDCIAVATRGAALADQGANGGLARGGNASREEFIRLFEAPGGKPVDYHGGIPQALTMMHGGLIHTATDLGTSGLLKSLGAPFFTDDQRIETLFLATLSRYPAEEELRLMSEHLAGAAGDAERQQRLGDVLWALLNTAEFTLNH